MENRLKLRRREALEVADQPFDPVDYRCDLSRLARNARWRSTRHVFEVCRRFLRCLFSKQSVHLRDRREEAARIAEGREALVSEPAQRARMTALEHPA